MYWFFSKPINGEPRAEAHSESCYQYDFIEGEVYGIYVQILTNLRHPKAIGLNLANFNIIPLCSQY